jgi:hypothetical protein
MAEVSTVNCHSGKPCQKTRPPDSCLVGSGGSKEFAQQSIIHTWIMSSPVRNSSDCNFDAAEMDRPTTVQSGGNPETYSTYFLKSETQGSSRSS